MADTVAGSPLTKRQLYTVFGGLMVGVMLSSLDTTIVATALPTIAGELHNLEHITWIATAYLLTSTAATPIFGKLSDLYGRRIMFQSAIVIFLAGSVLAGISQTFIQLVAARGIQGIGGGGLMATAFAIIGDVVPPRERGRYVGFLTSVFAFSAVVGPLVGGFFVDNLTWRWIFFVNLPIGLAALVVTSYALRLPFNRRDHTIDWLGAFLLVGGVTAIILMTTWGGHELAWTSAPIVGLGALGALLTVTFVWWENKAVEPILPMRLFKNPVFAIAVACIFCVGSALFSSDSFLPLFLQAVTGTSATNSGLLLTPLMAGVTVAAIVSGRLVAVTGRYKRWPLIGLGLASLGMALLSQLYPDTRLLYVSLAMLVLGTGLGMTMPIMTTAVQNAVEWRDMGSATSAVTFLRSLGGALGLAVYGAVFSNRLQSSNLPPQTLAIVESPQAIAALPEPAHAQVIDALAYAIRGVFLFATPVLVVAWVISFFLKEVPLRETSGLARSQAELGADGTDGAGDFEVAPAIH